MMDDSKDINFPLENMYIFVIPLMIREFFLWIWNIFQNVYDILDDSYWLSWNT